MEISVADAIASGIASAALVLGIVATWHNLARDRVRLRVVTQGFVTPAHEGVCFRITNLSTSAVFLERIDIAVPDRRMSFQFLVPVVSTDGDRLPMRIDPRAAVTFPMPPAREEEARNFRNVRVRTACGKVVRGANGRFFRRRMRSLAAAR